MRTEAEYRRTEAEYRERVTKLEAHIDRLQEANLSLEKVIGQAINSPINLEIEVKCPDCNGEGFHEIGPDCGKPASNCCGGCYHRVLCDSCDGGEVTLVFSKDEAICIIEDIIKGDINGARESINNKRDSICQEQ